MTTRPTTGPATGGLDLTRVTSIRATVKTPTTHSRHTVHTAAWLPTEGWWCTCDTHTTRRPCAHVTAVRTTITPGATP